MERKIPTELWRWPCILIISVLGKWKQEDQEFKSNFRYINSSGYIIPSLQKINQKKDTMKNRKLEVKETA